MDSHFSTNFSAAHPQELPEPNFDCRHAACSLESQCFHPTTRLTLEPGFAMLIIVGAKRPFYDGLTRRRFLKIGAVGTTLSVAGMPQAADPKADAKEARALRMQSSAIELQNTKGMLDINGAFTIEAWLRLRETSSSQFIAGDLLSLPGGGWNLHVDTEGRVRFGLSKVSQISQIGFAGNKETLGFSRWHHVAAVKTASEGF